MHHMQCTLPCVHQVVFPGLSDNEVMNLVNKAGIAGDDKLAPSLVSEKALHIHAEAFNDESRAKAGPSFGDRASAAVARRSANRRPGSPPPGDDPARRSPLLAADASDERPDLMHLGPGTRRRILQRQASGMHHSEAFLVETLPSSACSKPSFASRFALRRPSSVARDMLASTSTKRLDEIGRSSSGSAGSASVTQLSELALSAGSRARRSSIAAGNNVARRSSTAAGNNVAATFAFAVQKARNRASLHEPRESRRASVQSVEDMRLDARDRAEKMQKHRFRREDSSQRSSSGDISQTGPEDSLQGDARFERLMQRMEQLEASVSRGVQRMEDALLSPQGVAAANAARAEHAAQTQAADGEAFGPISTPESQCTSCFRVEGAATIYDVSAVSTTVLPPPNAPGSDGEALMEMGADPDAESPLPRLRESLREAEGGSWGPESHACSEV